MIVLNETQSAEKGRGDDGECWVEWTGEAGMTGASSSAQSRAAAVAGGMQPWVP